MGVVIRSEFKRTESFNLALENLKPYFLEESLSDEWPGTKIYSDKLAKVQIYELNADVVELLKELSNSFSNWQHPGLPEDLFLLRKDRSPWLANIAHENDVCFILTPEEAAILPNEIPGIGPLQWENKWPISWKN